MIIKHKADKLCAQALLFTLDSTVYINIFMGNIRCFWTLEEH